MQDTHAQDFDVADDIVDLCLLDLLCHHRRTFIVDKFNVYIFIWCFSCCFSVRLLCRSSNLTTHTLNQFTAEQKNRQTRNANTHKHIQSQVHVPCSSHELRIISIHFCQEKYGFPQHAVRKQPSAFVSHSFVIYKIYFRFVDFFICSRTKMHFSFFLLRLFSNTCHCERSDHNRILFSMPYICVKVAQKKNENRMAHSAMNLWHSKTIELLHFYMQRSRILCTIFFQCN